MATTASMTLIAVQGGANQAFVGSRPHRIMAKPLDANGLPSGANVSLSSSDTSTGRVTTATQLGNAPAGVYALQSGAVTITATALDNTAVTATMAVTCT